MNDAYAMPKPKKPDVTIIDVTATTIEISWTQKTPPSVDEFRAEIREKGSGAFNTDAVLPSTTFTYTYTGLTPETTYDVRVTACNMNGCSSSVKERTTLPMGGGMDLTKKSGGACNDCIAPTLGIQERTMKRIVTGGFTYNNQTVDVDYFRTSFPLINTTVGVNNTATLKIYEETGIENIRHVAIAFGLKSNDSFGNNKAYIEADIDFRGNITLTHSDMVKNVTIWKENKPCGVINTECLEFTFYHTFTTDVSGVMGTWIWDNKMNSWQNYFNDGISIAKHIIKYNNGTVIEKEIQMDRNQMTIHGGFKRGTELQDHLKKSEAYRAYLTFQKLYGNLTNWHYWE